MDSQILAFIGVAAIVTLTPGADTMLVIRNTLARGRAHGVAATVGICAGLFVHAALSVLGLSVILVHSANLFFAVKTVGACYLAWLGFQSLRSARALHRMEDTPGNGLLRSRDGRGLRKSFLEGFFCNVLNPKVAIFYLALLPQFLHPGDPALATSLLFAVIHALCGLIWLCLLALFLGRLRTVVSRPSFRGKIEALSGVILIGFGLRLALEHR